MNQTSVHLVERRLRGDSPDLTPIRPRSHSPVDPNGLTQVAG